MKTSSGTSPVKEPYILIFHFELSPPKKFRVQAVSHQHADRLAADIRANPAYFPGKKQSDFARVEIMTEKSYANGAPF